MGGKRGTLEERYWRYVSPGGPDECWPWTGGFDKKGYGQLRSEQRADGTYGRFTATRVGWKIHHGTDPGDLHVLHSCDNPPCQNPAHWRLGTNDENIADRVRRGRSVVKLSPEQVTEIRQALRQRGDGRRLARQYGVAESTISRIKKGLR